MKTIQSIFNLVALLSAFVLMFAPIVSASPTGGIAGFVRDQSGAIISGAKLTLINVATTLRKRP